MKLPEIRAEVEALAKLIAEAADRLETLADEMKRRPTIKRTLPKNRAMSEDIAERVRAFAADNPGMSQQEVAHHFRINQGRVSEAVRGKRT